MNEKKDIKEFGSFLLNSAAIVFVICIFALFVCGGAGLFNNFNWNYAWLLLLLLPLTEIFYYYGVTYDMFSMRGEMKKEELNSFSFLAGIKFVSFIAAYTALAFLSAMLGLLYAIIYGISQLIKLCVDAATTATFSDVKGILIFFAIIIAIVLFLWVNTLLGRSWLKRNK